MNSDRLLKGYLHSFHFNVDSDSADSEDSEMGFEGLEIFVPLEIRDSESLQRSDEALSLIHI